MLYQRYVGLCKKVENCPESAHPPDRAGRRRTAFVSVLAGLGLAVTLSCLDAQAGPSTETVNGPAVSSSRVSAEQQNIAHFVASKYRLAFDDVHEFVVHAYQAAREFRIDPLLVLAIVSIESSFNPNARSPKGAQGLMQILTRVHSDKFAPFGGTRAAFDPLANLKVGSQILKAYLVREGSIERALKSYVGAALLPHDFGYGRKVLTEREKLAKAAVADNAVANKNHEEPAEKGRVDAGKRSAPVAEAAVVAGTVPVIGEEAPAEGAESLAAKLAGAHRAELARAQGNPAETVSIQAGPPETAAGAAGPAAAGAATPRFDEVRAPDVPPTSAGQVPALAAAGGSADTLVLPVSADTAPGSGTPGNPLQGLPEL
jgi:hypothetical protein